MPAIYHYTVEQTREIEVAASSPSEAVQAASEMFSDPHQTFDHQIKETSIRADRKF